MYIQFSNLSYIDIYLSVWDSGTWDYNGSLSDLPVYHPFFINSIISRLIFLKYSFCYITLLLKKSSAVGSYLYHKTRKPLHCGLLISTGFFCSSQTDIFTVLQTSFYLSTFIHSFPFYGISFFPLLLIEIFPFL